MYEVKSLHIYPIKSCGGLSVPRSFFQINGPQFDRQWMLIDPDNKFVTQRQLPALAKVKVTVDESGLSLGYGQRFIKTPLADNEDHLRNTSLSNAATRIVEVKIWKDNVSAVLEPDLVSQSLCHWLGLDLNALRLVRFSNQAQRQKPARFADSRAVLVVNESSLDYLNSKLNAPVSLDRFRANIVIKNAEAFAEEKWDRIQIGDLILQKEKLCTRCVIINIDPKLGEIDPTQNVLKQLGRYRDDTQELVFGVLYKVVNTGMVSIGDKANVLA